MRTLKTIILASAAVLTLSAPVLAADAVVEQAPAPEALPMEQPSGWDGAYVGVYGGYNWSKNKTDEGKLDADGFGGGAYGGYNMQNGQFVYGAEADLGYANAKESNFGYTAKQGLNGSVRARAGVALDPVLLYGTGGLAVTENKLSTDTGSDSNTHVGWTVGAGAEAKITQNVVGRVEYRYSDYGKKDYDLGGADEVSNKLTTNEVRLGVGYKF
ncbi:porin family protein [Phyllobacterium sp. 21LDTY02-6]|uniref:outer membrane protein n=1 Tax=unclassified Phyllobacterium TaxID=2638441 RepID=UPI002022331B|nr:MULTISPECIES: outer membrane protein [unclassified Phyllobacterium]MCO4319729.1 porin family protein [Phyllobacterium sp. 21LDTY02-6]MCX8280471.1 porin family protein [Phyllobacterium sp. 0TCS1.6C]MCX8295080.1 porin family protein [Phyllobacterium sp. 0TCS1.6A]